MPVLSRKIILIRTLAPHARRVQFNVRQSGDAPFDRFVKRRVAQIFGRLSEIHVEKPYLDVCRLELHARTVFALSENTFSSQCGIPLTTNHLTRSRFIGEYLW